MISIDVQAVKYILQDEIIELSVDFEDKTLFKNVALSYFWTNVNIT